MGRLLKSPRNKGAEEPISAEIAKSLRKAGVSSFELQTKVRVPSQELLAFLSSGWPPYDAKTGLVVFGQIGRPSNLYSVTLFLEGTDEKEERRLVLEIKPSIRAEKYDLPFQEIDRFFGFLRQRKKGFRFASLRGVLHSESTVEKSRAAFPLPFNENACIVGMRFETRKRAPMKSLIENVILELVGRKMFHTRIATKELSVGHKSLVDIIREVLSCRKDLQKLLRLQS